MNAIDHSQVNEIACRTLWTAEGKFIEVIDPSHVFNDLWVSWQKTRLISPVEFVLPTQTPSPTKSRMAQQASKPMSPPFILMPVGIMNSGYAIQFSEVRGQQIYLQWRERVDSKPDYATIMNTRGRYTGRLI